MARTPLNRIRVVRFAFAALVGPAFVACGGSGSGDSGGGDVPQDPLANLITDGAFLAEEGLVVVEFESLGATGAWASETALAGYTGSSYLRWAGANFFATPGTDTFVCDFFVEESGTYQLRIHNRHEHPNSTEANDVWTRMDGADWVKTFSWQRGQWTWVTQHEFSHGNAPEAQYTLTSGNHRLEFSGRSTDFCMDRFHLYLASVANPLDSAHPESQRHSASGFTAPGALVDVAELPASALETALVTLDSGIALDPRGAAPPDGAAVRWTIPSAMFADGTHEGSARARVVVPGGVALPVTWTRSPAAGGAHVSAGPAFPVPTTRRAVLQVAGSPWRVDGTLVVGGDVTLERPSGQGTAEPLVVTAPSGATCEVEVAAVAGRWRAVLRPDEAGVWSVMSSSGAGAITRFAVAP